MKSVYLDNSSTTFPKPEEVKSAMLDYMNNYGCNINRGAYDVSSSVELSVFETRNLIKELFNAKSPSDVIFTSGATASLNNILKGILDENDHVIVSPFEHNAVMRVLKSISSDKNMYEVLPIDIYTQSKELISRIMSKFIKNNTKAVIINHVSNVFGFIAPIREIGEFCKKNDLYFILDTAQSAGVFDIDMISDNIDALAFAGHKGLLGPQGIGGMVLGDKVSKSMKPLIFGGTGSKSESYDMPDIMPDKFESGTLNIPGIFGLNAGLKYINKLGIDYIRNREIYLSKLFIEGINELNKDLDEACRIRVIGDEYTGADRGPIVSISTHAMDLSELGFLLDDKFGIKVRVGLHCAPLAHLTVGTFPEGSIRFSFGHLNNEEEVFYVIDAFRKILRGI